MGGPLSGYRVLEITTTVAGPMAAMVLADQGADVIKIEPPMIGDTARFLGSSSEGISALFAVLNRNKRSLSLDLKDDKDLRIFLELAKETERAIREEEEERWGPPRILNESTIQGLRRQK